MTALSDLINQVQDKTLRERIMQEVEHTTKDKKFGLVFEEHLPELTPIHGAIIRKGSTVSQKEKTLKQTWTVLQIVKDKAVCYNRTENKKEEFALDDLVVVSQFGEPIFPSLISMDRVQNATDSKFWHTLIEAENYHALQLLEYLYPKQIDCIYIDPPYNTGAKDWKYNNDYVDSSDNWRHSKWLSMMQRRLKIARRLLKPDTGVLIVTIDEHEMHHLRVLLEQLFPEYYIQTVTAVTNPKGVTQGRFSRVEEYLIYCFGQNAKVADGKDNLLNPPEKERKPRWKGLLRSGTNSRREDRKNMFYPILIDQEKGKIIGTGETLPYPNNPKLSDTIGGYSVAWPIRKDGSYGNWGVGYETLRKLIEMGYVSCGKYDVKRKTFGISYISEPNQRMIEKGTIKITGRDPTTNVVSIEYADENNRTIKTVWHRRHHDAGAYGSDLVSTIVGQSRAFSFPKSLYAVKDSLNAVIKNNPNALVLDFFAGSGTTLHAVNLLNIEDGGNRRCILVTNNEVSNEEQKGLRSRGLQPGQAEWEKHGICQAVTWPRSKYSIIGGRDDGSSIEGEYFTNRTIEKEQLRSFYQIGFTDNNLLRTVKKKQQLVAVIDKLPQSLVKKDSKFIVSEEHEVSILFDITAMAEYIDSLDEQYHISDFYIVTNDDRVFSEIKEQIMEQLGPMTINDEVKRPMSDGFASNVEYFKLDFLDKNKIELRQRFKEILPILWLQSGAIGPRPELEEGTEIPDMFIRDGCVFAILVEESAFAQFVQALQCRNDITYAYLVTNSDSAYREMASQLKIREIKQLYRDYINNFKLNTGRE